MTLADSEDDKFDTSKLKADGVRKYRSILNPFELIKEDSKQYSTTTY